MGELYSNTARGSKYKVAYFRSTEKGKTLLFINNTKMTELRKWSCKKTPKPSNHDVSLRGWG